MLTGGNGRYALDKLSLHLGQSDLEGGIAIDSTGKIVYLRADLTSRFLDLADFKGAYGGNPAGAAPKRPTPGDGKDAFDTISAQLGAHTADARKAAGGQ